jgi:hypothetical protein
MPTRSLPAASLRPAIRLPAARVLLRVSNYLICRTLSAIGTAIAGVESDFLPALRETPNGFRGFAQLMPSNFVAVPPRMAMRSSSLKNPRRGSIRLWQPHHPLGDVAQDQLPTDGCDTGVSLIFGPWTVKRSSSRHAARARMREEAESGAKGWRTAAPPLC